MNICLFYFVFLITLTTFTLVFFRILDRKFKIGLFVELFEDKKR